jgi:thioredoxin 1
MAITVTKNNFEEIINGEKPALIDFWAPWCGPCRMLGPIVEEFAQENTNVVVGKVNVDDEPELASRFGIMTIPTLIVFKNGEVVNKSVGLISKEDIENLI